jgi:hypothetical protein
LQIRKDEIEDAAIEEIGRLFNSWITTTSLTKMVNEELSTHYQQETAAHLEITRRLEKTEEELTNIRRAVKDGLEDVEWANQELRHLKQGQTKLRARKQVLGTAPKSRSWNRLKSRNTAAVSRMLLLRGRTKPSAPWLGAS